MISPPPCSTPLAATYLYCACTPDSIVLTCQHTTTRDEPLHSSYRNSNQATVTIPPVLLGLARGSDIRTDRRDTAWQRSAEQRRRLVK